MNQQTNIAEANKDLKQLIIEWPGHDLITLNYLSSSLMVKSLKVVGCHATMSLLKALVAEYKSKPISEWSLPNGNSHSEMLVREMLLKAQNKWIYPYEEEELCHCRGVPTIEVDRAVLGGSHTVMQVTMQTGAASACSACSIHIEKIIKFRQAGS